MDTSNASFAVMIESIVYNIHDIIFSKKENVKNGTLGVVTCTFRETACHVTSLKFCPFGDKMVSGCFEGWDLYV